MAQSLEEAGRGAALKPSAWRTFARSVRGRLALLAAALVLTAGLTAALVAVDSYRAQRRETERQLAETASALSLAVDGRVRESNATLRALATSPYLRSGDFAAFDRQARELIDRPDVWIGVIDRSGQQRANTRLPPGAPLPNVSREPEFDAAWARAEKLYISDLGQSGSQPRRYTIEEATVVRIKGRPAYLLAMAVSPTVLSDLVAGQDLPSSWTGALVDGQGKVIARSRDADTWTGRHVQPEVLKRLKSEDRGVFVGHSLDGEVALAAYRRSPLTGWSFVVAVPMRDVNATLTRVLAVTALVTFGMLAIGVALAVRVASGMASAIEVLARSAAELGRDSPVAPVRTGLIETDAVARELHSGSVKLAEREKELLRLNETLEARVAERSRELAEAVENLVHARKVEAIGRLTGGTAHDFNNLLTAVIGNLDLLGKRLKDEALRKYVDRARQAAERGAGLTAQLLAFARRQRLTVEPLDIAALVDGVHTLLDSSLGGAVRVDVRHAQGPVWAMADRNQLELVVLNLTLNARDAMPEGGTVTVETGRERVETPPERPEGPPPGDYVTVTVTDTGTGMPPDVLTQMWEPFFTTKAPGRGSGLGLSQVLGVAKQLGGGVRVESTPGRGTRVAVYLPAALPAKTAVPVPEPRALNLAGVRVLLVDDDLEVRRTTASLLRELGCEVEEAGNGFAGIERLEAGLEPQIVVMDYAMPGMTGSEAARRIAARWPSLPVLLITGYMETAALEDTWPGPVLGKPFSGAQLGARLSEVLQASD